MADTRAKTQSSDKTNPLSVSEMTLLYPNAETLAGFTLPQHGAKRAKETEVGCRGRVASEAERESLRFPAQKKKEAI